MSNPSPRRHDLDALRALAMLLGVVLHAFLAYTGTPWAVMDQPMSRGLAWIVPAIHTFRMPLFFLLSGFFTAMLWKRKGRSAMLKQRAARIALPLALGMVTIVPLQWAAMGWASQVSARPAQAGRDLWTAARLGDAEQVKVHLDRGESVNETDPAFGVTPLAWAALGNHLEVAQVLLAAGADPNAPNRDGSRPLHTAVFLGRAEIAKSLIGAGARLDIPDAYGYHVTQIVQADRATTESIVSSLGINVPWAEIQEGRQALRPLLGPDVVLVPRPPPGPLQGLMDIPLFHHLWFLWHLCWLVVGFWVFTVLADRLGLAIPTYRPWVQLPLIAGTAGLFTMMGSDLGTDTAIGLIPYPRVLATYALFFGTGAWLFLCEGVSAFLRRGAWWLGGAVLALTGALAIEYLSLGGDAIPAWVPASLESVAAWGLVIGLMSWASRHFSVENPRLRLWADSAYWIYLLHLPLVVVGQGALSMVSIPSEVKAVLLSVVVSWLLFRVYVGWVRFSWIGALLNGKRADRIARTWRDRTTDDGTYQGSLGAAGLCALVLILCVRALSRRHR